LLTIVKTQVAVAPLLLITTLRSFSFLSWFFARVYICAFSLRCTPRGLYSSSEELNYAPIHFQVSHFSTCRQCFGQYGGCLAPPIPLPDQGPFSLKATTVEVSKGVPSVTLQFVDKIKWLLLVSSPNYTSTSSHQVKEKGQGSVRMTISLLWSIVQICPQVPSVWWFSQDCAAL